MENRHGILSTMHLDMGRQEWQTCSNRIRHLMVSSEEKVEEAGMYVHDGVCVWVCVCVCVCVCARAHVGGEGEGQKKGRGRKEEKGW